MNNNLPFLLTYYRPLSNQSEYRDLSTAFLNYQKDKQLADYVTNSISSNFSDLKVELKGHFKKLDQRLISINNQLANTNYLLGNIFELLKIPEFEKERAFYIKEALKYVEQSTFDETIGLDAEKSFLIALEYKKQDWFVNFNLGILYMTNLNCFNLEKAIEHLQTAQKYFNAEISSQIIKRETAESSTQISQSYNTKKNKDEQLTFAADIFLHLALCYYALDNDQDAINFALKATMIKKDVKSDFFLLKYRCRVLDDEVLKTEISNFLMQYPDSFNILAAEPDLLLKSEIADFLLSLKNKNNELKATLTSRLQELQSLYPFWGLSACLKHLNCLGDNIIQESDLLEQKLFSKEIPLNFNFITLFNDNAYLISIIGIDFENLYSTYYYGLDNSTSYDIIDLKNSEKIEPEFIIVKHVVSSLNSYDPSIKEVKMLSNFLEPNHKLSKEIHYSIYFNKIPAINKAILLSFPFYKEFTSQTFQDTLLNINNKTQCFQFKFNNNLSIISLYFPESVRIPDDIFLSYKLEDKSKPIKSSKDNLGAIGLFECKHLTINFINQNLSTTSLLDLYNNYEYIKQEYSNSISGTNPIDGFTNSNKNKPSIELINLEKINDKFKSFFFHNDILLLIDKLKDNPRSYKLFFNGTIDQKKYFNLVQSTQAVSSVIEDCILYYDDTAFGKGDNGFFIDSYGIHCKNYGKRPFNLGWDQIKAINTQSKKEIFVLDQTGKNYNIDVYHCQPAEDLAAFMNHSFKFFESNSAKIIDHNSETSLNKEINTIANIIDNFQLIFSNDEVLSKINKLNGNKRSFNIFFHGSINERKYNNLVQSTQSVLSQIEDCILYYDDTAFGKGDNGFFIDSFGIHCKNYGEKPINLSWDEIIEIKTQSIKEIIILDQSGKNHSINIYQCQPAEDFTDFLNLIYNYFKNHS